MPKFSFKILICNMDNNYKDTVTQLLTEGVKNLQLLSEENILSEMN